MPPSQPEDLPPAEDLPPSDDLSPAHGGPPEPVPPRTVTVLLDRDSVAMGDDTGSHRERWTFPGEVTVGDLVLALVERHYLPTVDGAVAWMVELGHAEMQVTDDGLLTWVGDVVPVALLHADPGSVRTTFLRDPRFPRPLHEAAGVEQDQPVVVHLRYLSWGEPLTRRELAGLPTLTGARPLEVVRDDDRG